MSAATAFFMRDLRVAWSYRFNFFFQNASLVFSIVTLRFVANLLDGSRVSALQQYGGDYFSFVLIGAGLSLLAYPITKSFAGGVRAAQVTGTFEAMLTTRVSGVEIVMYSALYSIAVVSVQLVFMWALGAALFGAHLDLVQLPLALVVVFMTVAILTGIGLLSAAFTIAFKQSEPVTTAFIAGSLLVSGIMYPVTVLPSWLQPLSPLLPLTHAADLDAVPVPHRRQKPPGWSLRRARRLLPAAAARHWDAVVFAQLRPPYRVAVTVLGASR